MTDELIEASSLGAEGMAELYDRTPGHRLAAIRRKTAVRDAVDDLAAAFGDVTPLVRIQARNALEDLARHVGDASSDIGITAIQTCDDTLVRTRHNSRPTPDLAVALEQASAVLAEAGSAGRLVSVLDRVRGLLPDILDDKTARDRVLDVVCRARDDFVDADLAQVDLTGVWLEGVQWTEATRWPAGWEEQIRRDSEEIALGVHQVRG